MDGETRGFAGEIPELLGGIRAGEDCDFPPVATVVEQLAGQAAIPVPSVFILPSEEPNAIATGFSPYDAAVSVTTGLLELLNPRELRAVVAHEIGHIVNGDVARRTAMVASTMDRVIAARTAASALFVVSLFTSGILDDFLGVGGMIAARMYAKHQDRLLLEAARREEFAADYHAIRFGLGPELAASLAKMERSGVPNTRLIPVWARGLLFDDVQTGSTHPPTSQRISAAGGVTPLPDDVDWCAHCGAWLVDGKPCGGCGTTPPQRRCCACDHLNRTGNSFCTVCGTPLTPWPCGGCGTPATTESPFCDACGLPLP